MGKGAQGQTKVPPRHLFGRGEDNGWLGKAKAIKMDVGSLPKKAKWTMDEVKQYQLMVVKGKVYDVRSFTHLHPGGSVILSYLGRDGTDAFSAFHDQKTWLKLKDFLVGDLAQGEREEVAESPFALEMRSLRQEFVKEGLFESSTLYYIWKVFSTLSICATALYLMLACTPSVKTFLGSASLLGLFFQQTGWLAHDFSHNQVFKNRMYNRYMVWFLGNFCQGFSRFWWNTKHNRHHAVPNATDAHNRPLDEDIDTLPLLAWDVKLLHEVQSPRVRSFLKYQHILMFPILSVARFAWALGSLSTVVSGEGMMGMEKSIERISLFSHYGWYLGAALYAYGLPGALAYFVTSQMVAGLFLSFVFVQSHNGMEVYHTLERDFYSAQMVSTRDVHPGLFNDWFTGGLNYQIEHHLFPTMPRHNLGKVQKRVRALCDKHGVIFDNVSMWKATTEVINRLKEVAKAL